MLRIVTCLVLAAAAAAVGVVPDGTGATEARRCRPTESDVAGPFANRITAPRRAKIGKGHLLQGRVLRAPDCAPVARARVVLWQAGPKGYTSRTRGSVVTDRLGRFRFEGPVPTSYTGRSPHIHIAVIHGAYDELLTRYVVRKGAKTGRITLVLAPVL